MLQRRLVFKQFINNMAAASAKNLSNFTSICRQIIGVARNYWCVLKANNISADPEPLTFFKLPSNFVENGGTIEIPQGCDSLVHEVELGVIIGSPAYKVSRDHALDHVAGYTVALDMTNWSSITKARKEGLPWALAKGFHTSLPVGDFIPKEHVSNPQDLRLWLTIGGKTVQDGNTSNMVFSTAELLSYWSQHVKLLPGDLLLTGTPAGASPVKPGDVIEAGIDKLTDIKVTVK